MGHAPRMELTVDADGSPQAIHVLEPWPADMPVDQDFLEEVRHAPPDHWISYADDLLIFRLSNSTAVYTIGPEYYALSGATLRTATLQTAEPAT